MIEDFYVWCRKEEVGRIYPREYGLYRKTINDDVDLVYNIGVDGYTNCYASIFSSYQIVRRMFDTVFIDIDSHNGSLADAYAILQKVLDAIDVSRVYMSGRGFHCYVDFPTTRIENYGYAVRKWLHEKDILKDIDVKVCGDMRRVARIPHTKNANTGTWCVMIDPEDTLSKIREKAMNGISSRIEPQQVNIVGELLNYDRKCKSNKKNGVDSNVEIEMGSLSRMPKCIIEGVNRLVAYGELEHYWRLHIAVFLVKIWGKEKTEQILSMASDYDRSKTEYQLNYIMDRDLKCYSCRKLKDYGICVYDKLNKCPFYVLSNGWLERVVGRDVFG